MGEYNWLYIIKHWAMGHNYSYNNQYFIISEQQRSTVVDDKNQYQVYNVQS